MSPTEPGNMYKWGNDSVKYSKKRHNISDTKFDMAYISSHGRYRMPTKAEFDELVKKCTSKFVLYKEQKGVMFTSKINGNQIFFPMTKYREIPKDLCGFYWSGSGFDKEWSWFMQLYDTGKPDIWHDSNNYYMAIRPVSNMK